MAEEQQPHVVFTLHGIRTRANWQRSFADIAQEFHWMPRLDRWSYGYFSAVRFLMPGQRRSKVEWFNRTYQDEIGDKNVDVSEGRHPSIIVHSFGSYILGNAMLKYETLRFNKVILCGSILPKDYPWHVLLNRGQIQAIRNEYGVNDRWSRVVRWFVHGTGDSGVHGFSAKHPRLEQQHFAYFTHSDYFDRSHMREMWIPFLNRQVPFVETNFAEQPSWRPKHVWPLGLYFLYLIVAVAAVIGSALLLPSEGRALRARMYLSATKDPQVDKVTTQLLEELMNAQEATVTTAQGVMGGGFRITPNQSSAEQVWTTAQAMTAVTGFPRFAENEHVQIRQAFDFIERSRQKTPPETGWFYYPEGKSHTITEINAWVQIAYIESLRSNVVWNDAEEPKKPEIESRVRESLKAICERQVGGGWGPISVKEEQFTRTYSTVMAVWALTEARKLDITHAGESYDQSLFAGVNWLMTNYDSQLGWVPNPHRAGQNRAVPALTAQTFYVLSRAATLPQFRWLKENSKFRAAREILLTEDELLEKKLTDIDTLEPADWTLSHVRFTDEETGQLGEEQEFRLESTSFVPFPWYLAAYNQIRDDDSATPDERLIARERVRQIFNKIGREHDQFEDNLVFRLAETLIGIGEATNHTAGDGSPERK